MSVDSFLNNRNDNIIEVVISKNNIPIRLTYKQWAHITENHDYMSGCADMVLETIAEPDVIVQGQRGELLALKHYDKTVITENPERNNIMAEMNFLRSVPYLLSVPSKKIWADYDDEADVLYVSFHKPQQANDSFMEDNIIRHIGIRCWSE